MVSAAALLTPHSSVPRSTPGIVEEAFEAHRAGIVRMVFARTHDLDLAEDITQEAFLRFTREVERGRVPDNAGGWLHRVAANLLVSGVRRRQVAERHAPALLGAPLRAPEAEVVGRDELRRVAVLMQGLSVDQRTAIALVARGRRPAEIARAMGKSEAAVRTLVCRARARLRSGLEPQAAA